MRALKHTSLSLTIYTVSSPKQTIDILLPDVTVTFNDGIIELECVSFPSNSVDGTVTQAINEGQNIDVRTTNRSDVLNSWNVCLSSHKHLNVMNKQSVILKIRDFESFINNLLQ